MNTKKWDWDWDDSDQERMHQPERHIGEGLDAIGEGLDTIGIGLTNLGDGIAYAGFWLGLGIATAAFIMKG